MYKGGFKAHMDGRYNDRVVVLKAQLLIALLLLGSSFIANSCSFNNEPVVLITP